MRSFAVFIAFIVCGLFALQSVGVSQDEPNQSPTVTADEPGSVHKRLTSLAGTWDVALQYTIGEKQHAGKAICEARSILDGRFLQQDYHSRFQGKPFHVVQLLGYDNRRKKTIEIMMDNLGTGLLHNEGGISEDGAVITNGGESVERLTNQPYKLRTVTTIVDADHFTLEWFRTNGGGKEEKVVSMTHTRKKS
jgi:Protein of unknown function (DUF1579)